MPIRVVILDESALIRKSLTEELSKFKEMRVVASAGTPFRAERTINEFKPDVIIIDVDFLKLEGMEFFKSSIKRNPIPYIIMCTLTQSGADITMDALEAGAVDLVIKPSRDVTRNITPMIKTLKSKVIEASKAEVKHIYEPTKKVIKREMKQPSSTDFFSNSDIKFMTRKPLIIAIGASTGGTEAIKDVIADLPSNTPGIVIVQHMPPGFTKLFAERLDKLSKMEVIEASDGDLVKKGRVLIAPGDMHMKVNFTGGEYRVRCFKGELVNGHMPAVDVLFESVSDKAGSDAIGVVLTGMGRDGAKGMLSMRNAGARTIAQDKDTSVVFGMPMEAHKNGGAEKLMSIHNIAGEITKLVKKMKAE